MKYLLAVDYRENALGKDVAVVGVKSIEKTDDGVVIHTEIPEKSVRLSQEVLKRRDLRVYAPTEDDMRRLFANRGMFDNEGVLVDGRAEHEEL
ncbi:MAG: hypothetical protein LBQ16_03550 [Gracilibacteraceae bacterium]|nr:hypothetical protein [Gracilibacteraceae bacterium]